MRFELMRGFPLLAFQASALDHYANPPEFLERNQLHISDDDIPAEKANTSIAHPEHSAYMVGTDSEYCPVALVPLVHITASPND